MQSFLNSIQSVTLILLLTATGYICGRKGWFSDNAKAFISKFLITIICPCTCIFSFRSKLTLDVLYQSGNLVVAAIIIIILTFLLGYIVARLMKLPRKTLGVFVMMTGSSNTLFIGFPMCTELFGPDCVIYVIIFYMISTCFTLSLGNALIMWSGDKVSKTSPGKFALDIIKSPPIIGVVIGLLLVIIDFNPPSIVMTYMQYMNNLVTPLALLITGKIIYDIGFKNLKFDRVIIMVLIFRFIISPAICLIFCKVFGVTGLARSVFMVQAAMPTASQSVVSAVEYGADEDTAARASAISTLSMFVVIPILMLFLQ